MAITNQIEKALEAEARRLRKPLNVKLELLPVCNLNCRMCYIRTDMATVRRMGGLIPADRWLAMAQEMRDAGAYFLLLTGGEVFLYPEFRRLYAGLHEMGFSITINTNATLIDEETADWLSTMPPQLLSISLYGASDGTYEALCGQKGMFARVDHALHLMKQRGLRMELKTMLNPLNVQDAAAMAQYARDLGVFYEAEAYAFPPARKCTPAEAFRFSPEEVVAQRMENRLRLSGPEEFARGVLSHLRKYEETRHIPGGELYGFTCGAANSSCWITWQGRMTPCGMIASPGTLPFETGFLPAWEALKAACDRILMSPRCSHCEKRAVCSVCPAANLAETGRFDEASPFHCRVTEETLERMQRMVAYARAQSERLGEKK